MLKIIPFITTEPKQVSSAEPKQALYLLIIKSCVCRAVSRVQEEKKRKKQKQVGTGNRSVAKSVQQNWSAYKWSKAYNDVPSEAASEWAYAPAEYPWGSPEKCLEPWLFSLLLWWHQRLLTRDRTNKYQEENCLLAQKEENTLSQNFSWMEAKLSPFQASGPKYHQQLERRWQCCWGYMRQSRLQVTLQLGGILAP